MIRRTSSLVIATLVVAGCNVSSVDAPTGGVGPVKDSGACAHGTVVVLSDWASTQIALSTPEGETRSASFLSTGSTKTDGLAFALSGDVALPNVRPASGRVVLLDRYGTNVVTWADPATGKVLAQLPVGTGFESNPADYLEVDSRRAYVTRWGTNAAPGAQAFDNGNDLLVIDGVDEASPKIVASLPMPADDGFPARPSGMVSVSGSAIVVLQRLANDFKSQGDTQLVGVRDAAVGWKITLTGVKGCARPALAPSGRLLAISCSGSLKADGTVAKLTEAAIVTLDVSTLPPREVARFPISDKLGDPPGDAVAFASESLLVGKTQTALGGDHDNQVFVLDLRTGDARTLLRARKDDDGKSKGLVFGSVRCAPGCGDVCLLADADRGLLQRWHVAEGALEPLAPVVVESKVGLPPIGLGAY